MPKGKRANKRIILIVAIIVILVVVVGGFMIFRNYVNIRGQHLNKYRYSSGGGMSGGYHAETVKRYDDNHALISIESAEWYNQDPTVTEYLTDVAVMDELESVVRNNNMNFWNEKKFSNVFVHDGESESYSFYFDEEDISFSSQIYPMRYRKKLDELDSVLEKYIEVGEKLPGLVNSRINEDESYFLPEDELEIYVYSYAEDALGLKILNGTDEDVEIAEKYKLINADTDTVLVEEDTPYGGRFSGKAMDEMSIKLKERLDVGSYRIIFGELDIPFEIR